LNLLGTLHQSSGTTGVDIVSGVQTGFKVADMSRCSFGPLTILKGLPNQLKATLSVKGAASDPLVWAAADIDYEGVFTILIDQTSGRITIEFDGKIDAFPAFEGYATYKGTTKALFQTPPPKGNTVMNLPGSANRPQKGSVVFP